MLYICFFLPLILYRIVLGPKRWQSCPLGVLASWPKSNGSSSGTPAISPWFSIPITLAVSISSSFTASSLGSSPTPWSSWPSRELQERCLLPIWSPYASAVSSTPGEEVLFQLLWSLSTSLWSLPMFMVYGGSSSLSSTQRLAQRLWNSIPVISLFWARRCSLSMTSWGNLHSIQWSLCMILSELRLKK